MLPEFGNPGGFDPADIDTDWIAELEAMQEESQNIIFYPMFMGASHAI